jgi:hypothetical protein
VNGLYWVNTTTLLSIGNDGCMCTSSIDVDGSLIPGLALPLLSFSGLVRILPYFHNGQRTLLIAGYLGNTLAVVDSESGYEFWRVDTGGRGRGVTLDWDEHGRLGVAICASRKDGLNVLHTECYNLSPLSSEGLLRWSVGIPLHRESIFDVCAFALSDNMVVVVTASEDCSSRLAIWQNDKFVSSMEMTPQESGVRAVCYSQATDSLETVVAVGGSKLALQFFLVEHRDTGVRIRLLGQGRTNEKSAMDHRINTLASLPAKSLTGGHVQHIIAAGDSRGRIILHAVYASKIESSRPDGCCIYESDRPILSVKLVEWQHRRLVVFGTTGGDVGILDISNHTIDEAQSIRPLLPLLAQYHAHTVGANAISVCHRLWQNGQEGLVIASGGDDQRLTWCSVKSDKVTGTIGLGQPVYLELASISAIRGCVWIDSERVATVGYGGRLAIWRWTETKLEVLETASVQVGDVNGMSLVPGTRPTFVVGGAGLQVFEVAEKATLY